jgi:hypothetical protein
MYRLGASLSIGSQDPGNRTLFSSLFHLRLTLITYLFTVYLLTLCLSCLPLCLVELRHLRLQNHAAITSTSNLHGKERQNPLGKTLHQLPVIYLAKPIKIVVLSYVNQ